MLGSHDPNQQLVNEINRGFNQQGRAIEQLGRLVSSHEDERGLTLLKEVLREQYRLAHGYGQVVVGAGYVGFFAIWAFARSDLQLDPRGQAAAALFGGLSIAGFVLSEVFQMIENALASATLEKSLLDRKRPPKVKDLIQVIESRHRRSAIIWPITLAWSLITGILALAFLLFPLAQKVFSPL
jgi:hypothetical protein